MNLGSKKIIVCAREGGANTILYFLMVHFAKRNMNSGGGGKRGRAKINSPQPPFFLPARASGFVPAARSAASCRFSAISDKMNSSQTVKTHKKAAYRRLMYSRVFRAIFQMLRSYDVKHFYCLRRC